MSPIIINTDACVFTTSLNRDILTTCIVSLRCFKFEVPWRRQICLLLSTPLLSPKTFCHFLKQCNPLSFSESFITMDPADKLIQKNFGSQRENSPNPFSFSMIFTQPTFWNVPNPPQVIHDPPLAAIQCNALTLQAMRNLAELWLMTGYHKTYLKTKPYHPMPAMSWAMTHGKGGSAQMSYLAKW